MIKVPKPPTDHADTALLAPSRYFSQKPLFQHVPRFLGRLFAGRNGRLTRKKSQGLRGTPNRCGVLRGQMAKVERKENSRKYGRMLNSPGPGDDVTSSQSRSYRDGTRHLATRLDGYAGSWIELLPAGTSAQALLGDRLAQHGYDALRLVALLALPLTHRVPVRIERHPVPCRCGADVSVSWRIHGRRARGLRTGLDVSALRSRADHVAELTTRGSDPQATMGCRRRSPV
jgi:hypothetical protein